MRRITMSRLRRPAAMAAAAVAALGLTSGFPASAAASTAGVTANCAGYTTVSAQYVRLTDGTNAAVGSIQLCRRNHESGRHEYFGRIEMYAPVQPGHFATAILYYDSYQTGGTHHVSCDTHQGHIAPGGTLCYTNDLYDDELAHNFRALGRMYRSNGSGGWNVVASGWTALVVGQS